MTLDDEQLTYEEFWDLCRLVGTAGTRYEDRQVVFDRVNRLYKEELLAEDIAEVWVRSDDEEDEHASRTMGLEHAEFAKARDEAWAALKRDVYGEREAEK